MQLTVEIDEALLVQARAATAIHDDSELIAFALRWIDPRGAAQARLRAMRGLLASDAFPAEFPAGEESH